MNRQDLAERLKLWFILMKAGVYTRRGQGLPWHIDIHTGLPGLHYKWWHTYITPKETP